VVLAREDPPGDKRLVAYVVAEPSHSFTVSELRQFLGEQLPEYMLPSAFVESESLPLTAHGKLDRRALPAPAGNRPELETAYAAPRTSTEELLTGIWRAILRVEQVGIHDNFFELGGDSILSLQIIARANQAGLVLTPKQLFQNQTVAELAAAAGSAPRLQAEQGLVTGPVPLMPIQHWFFERKLADPQHWNMALLLEAWEPLDLPRLEQAVQQWSLHHDALRLRFAREAGSWRQFHAAPDATTVVRRVDLSALAEPDQSPAMVAAASDLQTSLDLANGPLLGAALFDYGPSRPQHLLLVIHHLVVDGVSWRILLADLQTAYQQLGRGEVVQLPPKGTSFKEWAERLEVHAQSLAVRQELAYWQGLAWDRIAPLPVDGAGPNTEESARSVSVRLSEEETRVLLQQVPAVYRTQINDVLLTALAQSFSCWTGRQSLLIDLEGHGREEIGPELDLSRTVGWFTTIFPVVLELGEAANPGAALKQIKETLRAIPQRGIGYGLLRYLHAEAAVRAQLAGLPAAEVSFNYLGQFDQALPESSPWHLRWGEPTGRSHSPRGERRHRLTVIGMVSEDRLQLTWVYSENLHQRSTIERLAEEFVAALAGLIAQCQSPEASSVTPSDFPRARTNPRDLDQLISQVSAADIEDVYELSPMQEGMLFHTLVAPKAAAYFVQRSGHLHGELDVAAFQEAWRQLVARHSVLRTSFHWEELEKPLQVLHRSVRLPFEQLDWRELSTAEQEARVNAYLEADRARGFDLAQAPLMRLTLIHLADNLHHLVWSNHHLLLDGWSMPVLLKELLDRYEALRAGRTLPMERSRPYGDYIGWLQRQDMAAAERFFRQSLQGFTAPTPLAVGRSGESISAHVEGHAEEQLYLTAGATATLKQFAQEQRLTLNTLVQGAWALLLCRYSGEQDVLFGATVSGRPAELRGVESMVGLFINTLPVRVRVPEHLPLLLWLRQLQAQQLELMRYDYAPLVSVQGWSDIPRGMPLFESLLVFENYPVDAAAQHRRSLEFRDFRGFERTNYPLTLIVVPGDKMRLRVSYDRSRFEAETMVRLLGHLQVLLETMAARPQEHVGRLPLLTKPEQHQLLEEWNATESDYPREQCLHQLFTAQVERTPSAVAVVCREDRLTYAELNTRANQWAHHLQALGVGPEVRVGICVERSLEMVVGLLAILKAGGAYVPLDPTYPPARLGFLLEDAQVPLLLTQEHLRAALPAYRAQVLCLDSDPDPLSAISTSNPTSGVTTAHLAYVIYTSGSTGKPKGVAIAHQSAVALMAWAHSTYTAGQLAGVLASTSLCFDLSVFELFVPLTVGGTVILAENALQLPHLPASLRVTLLNTVPSAIAQLLRLGDLPAGVSTVNLAGELLAPSLVAALYQQPAVSQVWDLYGPSEDTTYSTAALRAAAEPATIGRPISNTRIYLLDRQLQPVPMGVAGELCIGGAGLARGYLNRPELTAERFIPDPFSGARGARLYRTGDLARYRSDGNLEFLGRVDHQVKVRGFRIELGEIEAVLEQHAGVRECVVVVREDIPGEKRLVGYVVATAPPGPSGSELRRSLEKRLPEHMLPNAFVMLEALPLTPNGKVDRRALPAPDQSRPALDKAFVAPRDTLEQQLTQIWEHVLGIRPIGVNDSFFDLGGHSLLAVRVFARIQKKWGKDLSLATLFRAPTVAQLAETLRQQSLPSQWSTLVSIQPGGSRRPIFFVSPGSVLLFSELARHLGPDQPFYGLEAPGLDADQPLLTRTEEIAAHHIREMQTLQPHGPYLLGGRCFGTTVAFEMAQQLQAQGERVAVLIALDDGVETLEPAAVRHHELVRRGHSPFHLISMLREVPLTEIWRSKSEEIKRALRYRFGGPQTRRLLRLDDANWRAVLSYQFRPYPGKVALIRSSRTAVRRKNDWHLRWSEYAAGGFEWYVVPGDHRSMLREPHVRALAERVRACLDEACAEACHPLARLHP
jgi:amino acid adenylation domain-containing protein/non-ribosomal peptide synthase protein (TIGR01720 family)